MASHDFCTNPNCNRCNYDTEMSEIRFDLTKLKEAVDTVQKIVNSHCDLGLDDPTYIALEKIFEKENNRISARADEIKTKYGHKNT